MFGWKKPAPPPITPQEPDFYAQFDQAKQRFDAINQKLIESLLPEVDKCEAQNLNEAEYRKALEKLICTY